MSLLLLLSPNDALPQAPRHAGYRPRRTRSCVCPPASGLALDGSSPPVARSGGATTDTAAFSPPAGLYLAFAIGDANNNSQDEQVTVTSTGGLTWTLVARANGQSTGLASTVEVWKARSLTPPGSIIVTETDNKGSVAKSLLVQVIVDLSGRGIPDTGAVAIAAGTATYTSTVPGSWGWAVGLGGSNANNTPGAGQVLADSVTGGGFDSGDNIWTIYQQYLTAAQGASVAMSVNPPPVVVHNVAVEVVPYLGLQPQSAQPRRACRMPVGARRPRSTPTPWPAAQTVQPPAFVAQPPRRARLAAAQRRPRPAAAPVDQQAVLTVLDSRRRLTAVLRRRPTLAVAPADLPPAAGRLRARLAGLLHRDRVSLVVPPQATVAAPPYPPQPAKARIRGARLARGRTVTPQPAQETPPPTGRIRQAITRIAAVRRGRTAVVVQAQAAPTPPAYPIQPVRTRIRGMRLGRGRSAQTVPDQVTVIAPPYPPQPVRTRLRGMRLGRGRSAQVVPAQVVVTPPVYPPPNWRARVKGLRLARGRSAQIVDQAVAPPQPARIRIRGVRPARGRSTPPILPQEFVPAPGRPRQRVAAVRRGRAVAPVAPQGLPALFVRVRARLVRVFRGRQSAPVPPQIVVVPPSYVSGARRTRRVLVLVARNRRTAWVSHACITGRPHGGTTPRASAGTTTRPNSGTTADPC